MLYDTERLQVFQIPSQENLELGKLKLSIP